MASLIKAQLLVFFSLLVACSSTTTNKEQLFGSGGEAGSVGVDATGGGAGENVDAGEQLCPDHMIEVGSICMDERPALLADGSQGPAVPWEDALTICTSRGLRLCTEAEREMGCPDGQISLNSPANGFFCGGPANTWEWSGAACSNVGHCLSPCCNTAVGYGCKYDACDTGLSTAQSYRCCKSK